MLIGVPKEIKTDEYRVGLVPATIRELTAKGHKVVVETRAGKGAGISDDEYVAAGAEIITSADQIFARCELIVKVKEPLDLERKWLRRGQIIFTYLHLAADPEQTRDLMASGVVAIAYETVTDAGENCRCWRRCPRSQAVWRRKSQPIFSNVRREDAVFFSVASMACPQARL